MTTLTEARLKACQQWPYGSHALLSLTPVERPGLGTLAVDAHWRLYYDPQALAAHGTEETAGVLLHEVSHLLLKHHQRAQRLLGGEPDQETWERWNDATDYAINSLLRQQGIRLWEGVLYPEREGMPSLLSADEYYRLLTAKAEAQKSAIADPAIDGEAGDDGQPSPGEGNQHDSNTQGESDETGTDGQGAAAGESGTRSDAGTGAEAAAEAPGDAGEGSQSDGKPAGPPGTPGGGGSCSDGVQRPWELPPPSECGTPGMSEADAECLIHQTAERILEKDHGQGAGAWQQIAQDILDPRMDPARVLLQAVRHAVEFTRGQGDYSYRRPSRRWPCRDILRPSNVQPIPRITVIVDTSGSMDQRDLGLCLGMIAKVLHSFRLRDGIRVVCGDEQATVDARAFDPQRIKLNGGGGTDMGKLIGHAAESKPRPQLVLVCTDGETPWGCDPGIPVVACITRKPMLATVPPWMKAVDISAG